MSANNPPRRRALRLVILNNSAPLIKMLCEWFEQHGYHCDTALLADMRDAHEEVGGFIKEHRPDVVIYDIGMPYPSSWDLLEVIRTAPALQNQPFVVTTPNKRKLEQAVGPTPAIEIGGRDADLRRVLKAVEAAVDGQGPPRLQKWPIPPPRA
jgi:CheY-like chemotaxis protein